jgi:hypothetical protein
LNTDIFFGVVCPAKDKALGLMLPVANTAGMIEHLRLIFHSKPDKIFQQYHHNFEM